MLQSSDLERTIEWYESVLGFKCTGRYQGNWCRLEREGVSIMFMKNEHLGAPHATAVQYIYVQDVFALWNQISRPCEGRVGAQRKCPTACMSSRSKTLTVTC
jgi:predicted enzyme related to lactoylglutathione lyase